MFKIIGSIIGATISGFKGKAKVEVAKIDLEKTKVTQVSEKMRILNEGGSFIMNSVKGLILLACLGVSIDIYFQIREGMTDELIMFILGFAFSIIGAVFGITQFQLPKVEKVRADKEVADRQHDKDIEDKQIDTIKELSANRLSNTFTLNELTHSDTADKNNIDNTIKDTNKVNNLRALCNNVIDVIKARYTTNNADVKFVCTSGYRCNELNKLIGGVRNSQHTRGQAVDFVVMDSKQDLKHLFTFITRQKDIPFDQIIYETLGVKVWIHISHKRVGINRRQCMLMNNGKYTKYKDA